MPRRDRIRAQMEQQAEHLNMMLEQAEAEAEAATYEAQRVRERRLAELRQLARSAHQQLVELDTVGEDQWDRLVVEGQKFERAFVHSYNYFKSQFA